MGTAGLLAGRQGMALLVQTQAHGAFVAYLQTVDRLQHTTQHHQQHQPPPPSHDYATAHLYPPASQAYDHLPVMHSSSSSLISYSGSGLGPGSHSSTGSDSHHPHTFHHPQSYTSYSSVPVSHRRYHSLHSHSPHPQHPQDGASSSNYRNAGTGAASSSAPQAHFHSQSTGMPSVAGPSSRSDIDVGDMNATHGVDPSPTSATASSSSSRMPSED